MIKTKVHAYRIIRVYCKRIQNARNLDNAYFFYDLAKEVINDKLPCVYENIEVRRFLRKKLSHALVINGFKDSKNSKAFYNHESRAYQQIYREDENEV